MLLLMPYFDESNRGPVAVGGLDPRWRHIHVLWIWFAVGLSSSGSVKICRPPIVDVTTVKMMIGRSDGIVM